jgi:hypothetical protein
VHTSIRISENLMDVLEEDAFHQNISCSFLITRILMKYVFFDRLANQVEAITMNGSLFTDVLADIPQETLESIGKKRGSSLWMDAFSFANLNWDLESLIKHLFEPGAQYSRWYKFNVVKSSSTTKLIFAHDYGRKWSAFLASYLGSIVNSATARQPKIGFDDKMVTISVTGNNIEPDAFA